MGFFERLIGEEPSLFQQWLHYDDKGSFGEYLVKYALNNISGYGKTLRNVYVPYKNEASEIDVLLIHEKGIFVFESKNYSGWIFGSENQSQWTQCLPNKQKIRFYNPMMQNKTHINALSQYLKIKQSAFISYIIFSQRCTLKSVIINTEHTILLKRPEMLDQLQRDTNGRAVLYSKEQVDVIYSALLSLTNVTDEKKQHHIDHINDKINHSTAIQGEIASGGQPALSQASFEQSPLYLELKQYRLLKSRTEGIKPYYIYNNVQLEEIVTQKPLTLTDILTIRGFGEVKTKQYGDDIVKIVQKYE